MHTTLSLGYTRVETEECKKKIFFLQPKMGVIYPGGGGGYTTGITDLGSVNRFYASMGL